MVGVLCNDHLFLYGSPGLIQPKLTFTVLEVTLVTETDNIYLKSNYYSHTDTRCSTTGEAQAFRTKDRRWDLTKKDSWKGVTYQPWLLDGQISTKFGSHCDWSDLIFNCQE